MGVFSLKKKVSAGREGAASRKIRKSEDLPEPLEELPGRTIGKKRS